MDPPKTSNGIDTSIVNLHKDINNMNDMMDNEYKVLQELCQCLSLDP